jgi:hypothetical protein
MSKKHTQSKQPEDTSYEPPMDAITQDLASHPADQSEAPPAGSDGKQKYQPLPDPFSIAMDAVAGVQHLRSNRFKQFQLRFEEKPPEVVLATLKEHKYRWAPKDQAWVKSFQHQEAFSASVESERLYEQVCKQLRELKGVGREI